MSANYTTADFKRLRDWVQEDGGPMFPTRSSLEWFLRQNRDECLSSGEVIIRRGTGGTLIGPGFGRLAVEIQQRKQQEVA